MVMQMFLPETLVYRGTGSNSSYWVPWFCFVFLFCFAVLGLELKAYTLSHSTSPFFMMLFFFSR
jgi:hypothetical protein